MTNQFRVQFGLTSEDNEALRSGRGNGKTNDRTISWVNGIHKKYKLTGEITTVPRTIPSDKCYNMDQYKRINDRKRSRSREKSPKVFPEVLIRAKSPGSLYNTPRSHSRDQSPYNFKEVNIRAKSPINCQSDRKSRSRERSHRSFQNIRSTSRDKSLYSCRTPRSKSRDKSPYSFYDGRSQSREKSPFRVEDSKEMQCFDGNAGSYIALTPITLDTAWVGIGQSSQNMLSNQLCLITNTGKEINRMPMEPFYPLSIHPIYKQLYGGFHADRTVRLIDTTTGETEIIVQHSSDPDQIKVTSDDHLLVATDTPKGKIKKYTLKGEIVSISGYKYQVTDIDNCPITNRVLISCVEDGVILLDHNLQVIHTFTGQFGPTMKKSFVCYTAVFDNTGNILVGDYKNSAVYHFGRDGLTFIEKVKIEGMKHPAQIRSLHHTLWIRCEGSNKIMWVDLL